MLIDLKTIKAKSDVIYFKELNEETRKSSYEQILDKQVLSKSTKQKGTITDITNKYLFLDFGFGGSVSLPLESTDNFLEIDESTSSLISDYLQTFIDERKLNRKLDYLLRS